MYFSLELGFLTGAAFMAVMCTVMSAYQVKVNRTKLSLVSLLTTPAHMVIIVLEFVRICTVWPEGEYWDTYISLICASVFATTIILCMLDVGDRFYMPTQGRTFLYKLVIICLILSNLASLIGIIYVYMYKSPHSIMTSFATHYGLFLLTGCLSCTYSFLPIFPLAEKSRLSSSTIAYGIWYATVFGSLAFLNTVVYIFVGIYLKDMNSKGYYVSYSIALCLRITIVLFLSFSPPSRIILWIRSIFFVRNMMKPINRERGVISSGIVDQSSL